MVTSIIAVAGDAGRCIDGLLEESFILIPRLQARETAAATTGLRLQRHTTPRSRSHRRRNMPPLQRRTRIRRHPLRAMAAGCTDRPRTAPAPARHAEKERRRRAPLPLRRGRRVVSVFWVGVSHGGPQRRVTPPPSRC